VNAANHATKKRFIPILRKVADPRNTIIHAKSVARVPQVRRVRRVQLEKEDTMVKKVLEEDAAQLVNKELLVRPERKATQE
jgi:hypothetical protein